MKNRCSLSSCRWYIKQKKEMQDCIVRCFEMAKKIDSPEIQRFLLSGLIVFTDKVIRRRRFRRIKRWIEMTKVGRLFEEEKQKAVQEAIKKEKADKKKALQRASADKERADRRQLQKGSRNCWTRKYLSQRKFLYGWYSRGQHPEMYRWSG